MSNSSGSVSYVYPGSSDYNNYLDFLNDVRTNNGKRVAIGKAPVDVSLNVPTSQIGIAVPYVAGRHIISVPEVISYANLQAIYQTDTETITTTENVTVLDQGVPQSYEVVTTTTVQTKYITGYKMDLVLGLCLGPEVKLVGIYYNNEKIWTGSIGPARSEITMPVDIDALSGSTMIFHGGAFDQVRDPVFDSDPDAANIPGYVGISYVIFRNIRADLPLEALFFEVERFPNPLGLTAAQNRIGNDINTVSALVDILVNDWGGAGLPLTDLDVTQIKPQAVVAYNEGNAVAVLEHDNASIKGICGDLLGVLNGMLYQNPGTGKLELSLIRKDFVFDINKNVTTSDIVSIRDFDKSGWYNTIEKLSGNYTDRSKDYKPNTIFARVANIRDTSRIGSRNYGYVMNKELSKKLLSRDLTQAALPMFALSFEATRKAADFVPGNVITVSYGDYTLYGTPIVVSKVSKLSIKDNSVIVEGYQLNRADVMPVFDSADESFDPGFTFKPVAPTVASFLTLPYWIARAVGAVNAGTSINIITAMALPKPANALQSSFSVYSDRRPDSTVSPTPIRYVDGGLYQTYAKIIAPISKYDGWTTGKLNTLQISSVINEANIANIGLAGIKEGKLFAIIGNEILSFESFTQTGVGEYTLNNVHRGLLDTVAEDHAYNDDIIIINNNYRGVLSGLFYQRPLSYDFSIVSSTVNVNGRIDVPSHTKAFPGIWGPNTPRTLSPYRVVDTKLNGVRNQTRVDIYLGTDITVDWKNRARTNQTVSVQADVTEVSEIAYNGKSQYVDIIVGTASVWQSDKDNAPPVTKTVTLPLTGVPLGEQTLYVKTSLDFSFGTLTSLYKDELLVNVMPNGLLISEDGLSYLTSENGNQILVQEGA